MRLTRKVGLILGAVAAVGMLSVAVLGAVILGADLRDREERMAQRDIDGAFETIEDDLQELGGTSREIVQITSLLFSQGNQGNDTGDGGDMDDNATAALADALFMANRIDHMFFLIPTSVLEQSGGGNASDFEANVTMTEHGLLMGTTYTPGEPMDFNNTAAALNAAMANSSLILGEPLTPTTGILATPLGPKMVASYGLSMPGFLEETARIIIVRDMDAGYARFLEQSLQTPVRIEPWPDGADREDLVVDRHGWSSMTLYAPVMDTTGTPAFRLAVEHDRDVYQSGALAYMYFLGAATLLILLLGVVAGLILRRSVTSRVTGLASRMRSIADESDWTERIHLEGEDELADMADAFDGVMGALERHTRDLERSNQDLARFASIVSHDLQSPLSTFTLNLPMLRRQAEDRGDDFALQCIGRMESTVARMQSRIRSILDYSKAQSAEPERRPVELDRLLGDVRSDLGAIIETKKARLDVAPLPTVEASPELLSPLFQNILSNALKYHRPEEPPHIQVWAQRRGDDWALHVRDHGLGFDPKDVPRMLRPFERLGNGDAEGHGIGLATCVRLLERLGGRLEVDGRPGRGALFTVVLPRARAMPSRA